MHPHRRAKIENRQKIEEENCQPASEAVASGNQERRKSSKQH